MTNIVHPPTPPAELMEELAQAGVAVARKSEDPLAPIMAMLPVPHDPGEMPVEIDEDEEIYALAMAGYTPSQIAHDRTRKSGVRVTRQEVDEAITRVSQVNLARTASQMAFAAQLELDRTEAAIKAVWPAVQDGNLLATDRFVKLSQAKREMLGLDAPDVKLMLTVGGQDALDLSTFSDEELKTWQALQRKASTSAKTKVVQGRTVK